MDFWTAFPYWGIHEIIPVFLLSLLINIVVSLLTKSRVPEEGHLDLVFSGDSK